MDADQVRADNQMRITKGISLTGSFSPVCQVVPSAPLIGHELIKECPKKRAPPPPTNPPTLPLPPLTPPLVFSLLPNGSLWPILHLPRPTADAWCVKKVRSSCSAEAPSLPLHREGLPCWFIIICHWHSAQVQSQCKRWHQRGGMRLATHSVISCP